MATASKSTVLLIRNAAPNDFGGAETYPVSLAQILSKNDWNPVIVSASEKLLNYAQENNVAVIRGRWMKYQNWSGYHLLLLPFYAVWQLYLTFWYIHLINKTSAHTLHIQSRDDFIAGTLAGHIMNRTVIWTDHMDLRYSFENIARTLRNPVGKLVFWAGHYASRIILISQNEYRLVTAHFKNPSDLEKQITIVKNGVPDQLADMPREKTNDRFLFCIASRVVKNKGIGEAIEAFTILQKNNPSFQASLHIYGGGGDLDFFKKAAQDIPNITFFGYTKKSVQAIHTSDAFLLPSYQEGFSIALLEATMLGKAIIASDVDSNSEIISDKVNGLLVPARDARALAEAMEYLYANANVRKELEVAARARYLREFNLKTIVEKEILPLY